MSEQYPDVKQLRRHILSCTDRSNLIGHTHSPDEVNFNLSEIKTKDLFFLPREYLMLQKHLRFETTFLFIDL